MSAWTTADEKHYIDLLVSGSYRSEQYREAVEHDPVRLLKNYIRSARRRDGCGSFDRVGVDGPEVIRYAEEALGRVGG